MTESLRRERTFNLDQVPARDMANAGGLTAAP